METVKKYAYIILDKDPTGLMLAHSLIDGGIDQGSILVVEKESVAAGPCRSEHVDGAPLDVLHGFKVWSRSAFARMKVLHHGLSIDIDMVVRAYKLRIARAEFPTSEASRPHGTTHFKIWPTGRRLLKYLKFEWSRLD